MQGTYWLTVLPETSQLRPRIKRALRGVDDDVRVTPTVDDRKAEPAGRAFGEKFRKGFERSGAAKIGAAARLIGAGFGMAADQAGNVVRHVGLAATAIGLAARITKGFALSLLAASTGLRVVAGVSMAKVAAGLGFTARQASKLASSVTRVTSAILLLTAVGKVVGFMNRASKVMAIATVGTAALIGVVSALASVLGGALVSALMVAGAAIGVFAGAAAGLLGPAIGATKLAFKGLSEGAKAFADTMKDVWGPADEAFNKMIGERMGPLLTQFRDLKMAVTDTFSNALTPAFGSLTGLMAGLQPRMTQIVATMGGLGSQIAASLASPETAGALDKMFAASDRFFGSLGPGISNAVSGLVQFSATAADTFAGAGQGISDQLVRFGEWLKGISPAQMIASFAALKTIVMNVWDVLKPVIQGIRDIGAVSAPALAPGFSALGAAISQAMPGLVRMSEILMPALSAVMERLSPIIPALVTAFTPWAGVLAQIAPPLASIVAQMAPLAPLIMVAVGAVKLIAAGMLVANTAMAAFSIVQGVMAAALGVGTAGLGANVIALTAHRAAMIAGTVASRAFAVAVAFATGPIGLVVAAVAAAGVALWAFFTKTETGRKLWDTIWTGIKTTVSVVWEWLKTTFATVKTQIGPALSQIGTVAKDAFGKFVTAAKSVWTAIQPAIAWIGRLWLTVQKVNFTVAVAALKALGTVIGWLWTNVVVPAFQGIASAVSTWWAGAQVVWDAATTAIGWVGDKVMWLWQTVAVPAFQAIGAAISTWWSGVGAIWDLFTTALDKVGAGVGILKDGFVTAFNAIKDVVTNVWNSIKGVIDSIANGIGGVVDKLRSMPVVGSLIPGHAAGSPPGFAGGRPATLSRRGQLSGPGTGTSDSILAMLSNDEGVVKASAMRGGGAVLVAAMNAGWTPSAEQLHALVPGFAEGLNPGADWLRSTIMQNFPSVTSIGGKRSQDGYGEHSSGNAIDVMIPGYNTPEGKATGDKIASWVAQNRDPLGVDGMIWRQTSFGYGGDWSSGKVMGDRGSDTQNHMDHLHIMLGKGRGAGAASVDMPADTISLASSLGGGGGSATALGAAASTSTGSSRAVQSARTSLRDAGQSVDDRTYARDRAQRRLDDLAAAGKDTTDAQRALDVANRELADAKEKQRVAGERLTEAEHKAATETEKSSDSSSSGVGDLGKSIADGFFETIGLDGSLFSNPFEWPTVKSIMAGVNLLGSALSGGTGSATSSTGAGGDPSGILGAFGEATGFGDMLMNLNPAADNVVAPATKVAPDTTRHGTGGGQAPGPGVYIENAGMSPTDVRNTLNTEWNHRTRTTKAH